MRCPRGGSLRGGSTTPAPTPSSGDGSLLCDCLGAGDGDDVETDAPCVAYGTAYALRRVLRATPAAGARTDGVNGTLVEVVEMARHIYHT